MHTENLALNHCTETKVIEDLHAVFPRVSISILAHVLIVVAVD
jgi:hypothetical protein